MSMLIEELKEKADIVCPFCGLSEASGSFNENMKQFVAHLVIDHEKEAEIIRVSLNRISERLRIS